MKSDIAPGHHTAKLLDNTREIVSFEFTATSGELPQIDGVVTAKSIPAIVVSSLATTGKLWSSPGLKGGADQSAIQPIASNGVNLPELAGANTFYIQDGTAPPRSLPLQPSSVPSLFLQLGAKPQTGTIVVRSSVPNAIVVIGGHPLKTAMNARTRVLTLEPKLYQIKITHEGYADATEQAVDLEAGETKTLTFDLVPDVHMGSLALERFPADTEVSVDGSKFGATDEAGNLNKELEPGVHTITLQKQGYADVVLKREIKPNLATAIAGELAMPSASAITFKTVPRNARVSYWRDGAEQKVQAGGGQTVTLRPGTYEVSAVAEHYNSRLLQFVVQPGKSLTVELALSPETAKPSVTWTIPSTVQDPGQWTLKNGWWSHDTPAAGWFLRNSGNFTISFLKQSSKVFFKNKMKPVQLIVDAQPNGDNVTYTLDDHVLQRHMKIGSQTKETRSRYDADGKDQFTMQIDISPEKLVVRDAGGQVLDEYKRPDSDSALGKFGVRGEVELSILGIR